MWIYLFLSLWLWWGLFRKVFLEAEAQARALGKKRGLKGWDHGIWSHHSWQIDGETMETVRDFIFLGSKITTNADCSHEVKRHLLLGRKAMTNLDSILKSRDNILLTNICLVKALVFPVIMYGCESWTVKKAERWGIDTFKLWCWRRHLRVPRLQEVQTSQS